MGYRHQGHPPPCEYFAMGNGTGYIKDPDIFTMNGLYYI